MKKSGFTLIELLITISIIAVLAAIGFVSYTTVLKSGRDSKRQSDLRAIQSAVEQYHNDQGFYPLATTDLTSGSKKYLNSVPQDPINDAIYNYRYEKISSSYCLYANLEGNTPGLSGCSPIGSYDFAVTPP